MGSTDARMNALFLLNGHGIQTDTMHNSSFYFQLGSLFDYVIDQCLNLLSGVPLIGACINQMRNCKINFIHTTNSGVNSITLLDANQKQMLIKQNILRGILDSDHDAYRHLSAIFLSEASDVCFNDDNLIKVQEYVGVNRLHRRYTNSEAFFCLFQHHYFAYVSFMRSLE